MRFGDYLVIVDLYCDLWCWPLQDTEDFRKEQEKALDRREMALVSPAFHIV